MWRKLTYRERFLLCVIEYLSERYERINEREYDKLTS